MSTKKTTAPQSVSSMPRTAQPRKARRSASTPYQPNRAALRSFARVGLLWTQFV